LNVSYVGTLLPKAKETLRAVLRAVALLRDRSPGLADRVRLNFVGTSNQPGGGPSRVLPVAGEEGVQELVREIPHRLPYLEALSVLVHSDVLLAFGSDEPHYTASKIYPMLLSGRPGLAVFHEASTVCDLVRSTNGILLVSFDETNPVHERVGAIASAFDRLLRNPGSIGPADIESLEPCLANSIARRFAVVFERVAVEGPQGLSR
jgi:hypothetical protein